MKCDDQQQFKDIIEAAIFSTPERFTNNSPRYPLTPTPVKNPSARKLLCLFNNILDAKKKNVTHQVVDVKSKRKYIKAGTNQREMKTKRKVNSK